MTRLLRVLLADDEPMIIRGLKKLISWESFGLEIVGEAADGRELGELIAARQPDLILSDISMPGASGIDIIRHIHDERLPIKVVFISAYQEFAYARQALQYGALDYLIKPVDTQQLERVVERAVSVIREESQEERNKEMLQHYEQKNRSLTIEELLERLTDGNRSTAADLASLGQLPVTPYVTACAVENDEYADPSSRWEERERKLVEFALTNIIKETVEQYGHGFVFRKGERIGILLPHQDRDEPANLMQDLHARINTFLKLQVSIGIGVPASSIKEADESYRSAVSSLEQKYFEGLNGVFRFHSGHPGKAAGGQESSGMTPDPGELTEALRSLDKARLDQSASALLDSVRQLAGTSKEAAVSMLYNTVVRLQQAIIDYGVEPASAQGHTRSLLSALSQAPTYRTAADVFRVAVDGLLTELAARMDHREAAPLAQVKAYVEEHYADNLTLESMAAMVYMNPYYFSSFFKKHTGQNFKTYITEVRMRHALRLLAGTGLMVYEIAERVGYNNARHFSDMFKKYYGKLPQEYRQSGRTLQDG